MHTKHIKFARILIIGLLLVSSATLLAACSLSSDDDTYIIQKQSVFEPSEWDDTIEVYGFVDDYSAAHDIANCLMQDGGNYRVINK